MREATGCNAGYQEVGRCSTKCGYQGMYIKFASAKANWERGLRKQEETSTEIQNKCTIGPKIGRMNAISYFLKKSKHTNTESKTCLRHFLINLSLLSMQHDNQSAIAYLIRGDAFWIYFQLDALDSSLSLESESWECSVVACKSRVCNVTCFIFPTAWNAYHIFMGHLKCRIYIYE